MSNSKTSTKRRAWTPQRRAEQAARCRKTRPWEKTTGPKTPAGKLAVRDNAYKHGLRSAEFKEILRLLRIQKAFIRSLGNK